MNYKDINDKWKVFLTENAFKEDIIIKPEKKKKKNKKQIITSEEESKNSDLDEFEEFQDQEEESIEEASTMSGGNAEIGSGNAFISNKEFKNRWGLTEKHK